MKINLLIASVLVLGNVGCASLPTSDVTKPASQLQCDDVETMLSVHGNEQYQLEFINAREEAVDLFWINYEGEEELKHALPPEGQHIETTYNTHPWVVRDKSGQCLTLFNSDPKEVVEIK